MLKKKFASIVIAAALLISISGQALAAFSDVPANHPYNTEIDFCASKGYMTGTGDMMFKPDASLTRAQLAIVWCRLLMIRETNTAFTDVSPLKNYYDTAAIVMTSLGILSGTSGTTFSPGSTVTREQLALITARTFNLGVADEDDYKTYADYAAISPWARDAVSACINAEVLDGLYDGQNFLPQTAVTRGELCRLLYSVSLPAYTVTIGPLSGGMIAAFPSVARPGTIIGLLVRPDTGKQLKAGTLKYNDTPVDGMAFIMPSADVVVTAEFENVPAQLESIEITTPPSVTTYFVGDTLDLTAMVVTAVYSDSTSAVISGYTTTPAVGAALNTEGSIPITVSYTEGGITKTTSFNIQVSANPS
jgi:hypothetical protein